MKLRYILSERSINWFWLIDFTLENGDATIHRYWREHISPHRTPNPTIPTHRYGFEVIEGEGRIVTGVRMVENGLMTDVYPVTNPQYVFSYKDENNEHS